MERAAHQPRVLVGDLRDDAERPNRTLRSSQIYCVIRHEPVARIEGSNLRYPDLGHLAPVDLGGGKDAGWSDMHAPQSRPRFGERRTDAWQSSRLARDRATAQPDAAPITGAQYARLVTRVRAAVKRALPAQSTVLVTSKGDDALLDLDCRAAWHFPCGRGRPLGGLPSRGRRVGDRAARGDARMRRRLSGDAGDLDVVARALPGACRPPHLPLPGRLRRRRVRDLCARPVPRVLRPPARRGREHLPERDHRLSTRADADLSRRARESLAYGSHHRMLLRPVYEDEELPSSRSRPRVTS